MITLSPGSLCDVCAEEYGPHNYPHSISCGHVLCSSCCNNIIQKTSSKHSPACPFCRVPFNSDSIRLIRIDFTPHGSGWSTPRQCTVGAGPGLHAIVDDTGDDDVLTASLNSRNDIKRLEYKVARAAAKKCTVEEVTALHKELQEYLSSEIRPTDKTSSLHLSSALLRAILMNHVAHSEATKHARKVEADLKDKLDEVENAKNKLENELRSLRAQYSQTAQECQNLRAELSRVKLYLAAVFPLALTIETPVICIVSSPDAYYQVQGDVSYITYSLQPACSSFAPGDPFTHDHAQSATPSIRTVAHNPALGLLRSESARPATPGKPPRRLSVSATVTPPKIIRSSSNESSSDEIQSQKDKEKEKEKERQQKEKDAKRVQLIQRWIPSLESTSPPTGRYAFFHSATSPTASGGNIPRSRTVSQASAALHAPHTPIAPPLRYKTPLSANSP
ncbi:hypothetical protein C8Q75DRAFT_730873 [Abortiporus biennis]|nr:hypothetical protein C8Q75DRAFT_730873 [Abortiporus biennis]